MAVKLNIQSNIPFRCLSELMKSHQLLQSVYNSIRAISIKGLHLYLLSKKLCWICLIQICSATHFLWMMGSSRRWLLAWAGKTHSLLAIVAWSPWKEQIHYSHPVICDQLLNRKWCSTTHILLCCDQMIWQENTSLLLTIYWLCMRCDEATMRKNMYMFHILLTAFG